MGELRLYTVLEAARVLRTNESFVRKCIKDGSIAAAKIGGSWKIREEELRSYVDGILPFKPKKPAEEEGSPEPQGFSPVKRVAEKKGPQTLPLDGLADRLAGLFGSKGRLLGGIFPQTFDWKKDGKEVSFAVSNPLSFRRLLAEKDAVQNAVAELLGEDVELKVTLEQRPESKPVYKTPQPIEVVHSAMVDALRKAKHINLSKWVKESDLNRIGGIIQIRCFDETAVSMLEKNKVHLLAAARKAGEKEGILISYWDRPTGTEPADETFMEEALLEGKEISPDFETLKQYIDYGFTLYAQRWSPAKGGDPSNTWFWYVDWRKMSEPSSTMEQAAIQTESDLRAAIKNGVKVFAFLPSQKSFVCVVVRDGGEEFAENFFRRKGFRLNPLKLAKVCVDTPAGGRHYYFKDWLGEQKCKSKLDECVFVFGATLKKTLTAAGSATNGLWTMKGNLSDIMSTPASLIPYLVASEELGEEACYMPMHYPAPTATY